MRWAECVYGPDASPLDGSLGHLALQPIGAAYGAAVKLRNVCYDRGWFATSPLPRQTVSVGNVTVGGTGKTPFVEMTARALSDLGRRPAILARGYGDDASSEDDDERLPRSLRQAGLRRFTDPDRNASAERAIEDHDPDVLILDDGFQHRRVERDLDVVLVDGLNGFGNERLLPAGPLREPLSSLRRADVLVITRANRLSAEGLRKLRRQIEPFRSSNVPVLRARHRPAGVFRFRAGRATSVSRSSIRDRPLLGFCGIGTPASFRFTLVRDLGLNVVDVYPFPDHHTYTATDRARLVRAARRRGAEGLITTRKDAVKWADQTGASPLFVEIEMEIRHGKQKLDSLLAQL